MLKNFNFKNKLYKLLFFRHLKSQRGFFETHDSKTHVSTILQKVDLLLEQQKLLSLLHQLLQPAEGHLVERRIALGPIL
jgi:hypothetical protein